MNISLLKCLVSVLALLVGPSLTYADDKIPGYFENSNKYFMFGTYFKVATLKSGIDIPLNSVIIMPRLGSESLVTIRFHRNYLSDHLIKELFFQPTQNILNCHPFSQRGIEATLEDSYLVLNIHSGVIFHLRNGMPCLPDFKTFVHEGVVARVKVVSGFVLYSVDDKIRTKLKDLYIAFHGEKADGKMNIFKLPDGTIKGFGPEMSEKDFPKYYPPRIINHREKNGKSNGTVK